METKATLKRIGGVWVIEVDLSDWVFLDMQRDCEAFRGITLKATLDHTYPGTSMYGSSSRLEHLIGVVNLEYKNDKDEQGK